ncbi:MAG: hypothetical protein II095_05655, partial [Bacteroidales bacterium]|nr:hypothetical protein [Bacteroidales bacterium]
MMDNLSAAFRLERFCSPKYLAILDYDRRNGTEYIVKFGAFILRGRFFMNNTGRTVGAERDIYLNNLSAVSDKFLN